jgi:hypothetical protein
MKYFIIEIEITSKCWDYFIGQIIMFPIKSRSKYHARMKFENRYIGSEFPCYRINKIHVVDTFLFSPDRYLNFNK